MEYQKVTRRSKDSFQHELQDALKKRREKDPEIFESSESEEDSDEYDDDFEEEEVLKTPVRKSHQASHKSSISKKDDWNLPSYLNDDDDSDGFGGGGSMFLKQSTNKTQNKTVFDPIGINKKSTGLTRSDPIFEDSGADDYEDDPILQLLKPKTKVEKHPTPAKRRGNSKDQDDNFLTSTIAPSSSFSSRLQQQETQQDFKKKTRAEFQGERMKSPVDQAMSPKGRKSPSRESTRSPIFGKQSPELNRSGYEDRAMSPKERKSLPRESTRSPIFGKQSPELNRSDYADRAMSPKGRKSPSRESTRSPIFGKQSPEIKGIITAMKSGDTHDSTSHQSQRKVNKTKEEKKTESFVDFLLDPSQSKPVPKKRGNSQDSQSRDSLQSPHSRSLSPTSKERKDRKQEKSFKFDEPKQHRTLSGELGRSKSPPTRSLSPQHDTRTLTSSQFPSLQPIGRPLSTQEISGRNTTKQTSPKSMHKMPKSEKEQSHSDANDILTLFDQAVQNKPVDLQAKIQERKALKSPVTEVVEKTEYQNRFEGQTQRSSRQLFDNVINNVAQHNDTSDMSSISDKEGKAHELDVKSPRTKSGKKSYRTPPTNYQGLGSLTMLKELKKGGETLENDKIEDVSTDDIRKKVYLDWLAKREEEAKKKRKLEAEKKKIEQEKLKEESLEKAKENMIVRRKWEEVKKEEDKKKAHIRRKQEDHKEQKKEEKQKQKLKSEKDAEKRRQQLLETARIKHRAELRKTHQEQKKIENEKSKQKKENKKAVENWMDNRSEKWVEERKKEEKEKLQKEKEEKKRKKEDAETAEDKYNTWREKKDNQLKTTLRENKMKQRRETYFIEDDEENQRPPWSPANKVIPRRR